MFIKGRFFSRHRHRYASKQFKLKYWKDEGIQQQNFSEQHNMKIGSNRNINRDHKKLTPLDVPKTVISVARHDLQ